MKGAGVLDVFAAIGGIGGLFGGAAGVISLFITLRSRKPHLEVSVHKSILLQDTKSGLVSRAEIVDRMLPQGMPIICCKLKNPREKPVEVVQLKIVRPNGLGTWQTNPPGDNPLPCRIESVEATRFWFPIEEVARTAKQDGISGQVTFTVEAKDSMDQIYVATFELDVDNPVRYEFQ